MPEYLCISIAFLDERFHGRGDGGEPEWPPSPLRLFQSLVAANGEAVDEGGKVCDALHWLEKQPPPTILTPACEASNPLCLSVPNNAMDIVGKAWSKGNYSGSGDANPATHRTMKTVCPTRMIDGSTVHYLWSLPDTGKAISGMTETLAHAAGRIFSLGWGVDMVAGHGKSLGTNQLEELTGECWKPGDSGSCVLRSPISGTLGALKNRHKSFLNRIHIQSKSFTPADPLNQYKTINYRRTSDPHARPHVVFELRKDDGDFFQYPQRKLIHLAGMLRHLAIDAMKHSPPQDIPNAAEWIDRCIAGHARDYKGKHRQFSYLPLPSIGMAHTDPAVRRVMISAPVGDGRLLEHLAVRLAGLQLKPERGDEFGTQEPPTLQRTLRDKVASFYTGKANTWASVTPVILPGHDDHKPAKTIKLIEKALRQSNIEHPCAFEWQAISWWPKSLSAHKYDRHKKPTGYIRPKHLLNQTAVHLKLKFNDQLFVPGPLAIGAGRHCGLGLMAKSS